MGEEQKKSETEQTKEDRYGPIEKTYKLFQDGFESVHSLIAFSENGSYIDIKFRIGKDDNKVFTNFVFDIHHVGNTMTPTADIVSTINNMMKPDKSPEDKKE